MQAGRSGSVSGCRVCADRGRGTTLPKGWGRSGKEAETRLRASLWDVDMAGLPCSSAARDDSRQASPEGLGVRGFRGLVNESEREIHAGQDDMGSGGPVDMRAILDHFSVLVADVASAKEIQLYETVRSTVFEQEFRGRAWKQRQFQNSLILTLSGAPSDTATNRLNSAEISTGSPRTSNRSLAPMSKPWSSPAENSGSAGLTVPGHGSLVRAHFELSVGLPVTSFP